MNIPFHVDLSNKVVAVTGAGGVICSEFARALAACGAKVALLDINYDAAKAVADSIGENAIAVKCNCLEKASIEEAKATVNARFGKGKVFSAAEGIGAKSWAMKRGKLSKRFSTRWDELLIVK